MDCSGSNLERRLRRGDWASVQAASEYGEHVLDVDQRHLKQDDQRGASGCVEIRSRRRLPTICCVERPARQSHARKRLQPASIDSSHRAPDEGQRSDLRLECLRNGDDLVDRTPPLLVASSRDRCGGRRSLRLPARGRKGPRTEASGSLHELRVANAVETRRVRGAPDRSALPLIAGG